MQKALKLNVEQLVNAGAALLKETSAIKRMQSVTDELLSHKTAKMVNWFTRNAALKPDSLEKRSLGHGNISGKIKVNNSSTFTSFRKVLKVEPLAVKRLAALRQTSSWLRLCKAFSHN